MTGELEDEREERAVPAAQSIHPHFARPRTWWTAPKTIDDSAIPRNGTSNPRKSTSSPSPLAMAIAKTSRRPRFARPDGGPREARAPTSFAHHRARRGDRPEPDDHAERHAEHRP